MKLFLLNTTPHETAETLILGGEDFHYLCRVRRLSPGEQIKAKDREGYYYQLKLISQERDRGIFSILERQKEEIRQEREIHLFQAMPKGKKMDLVVRQAAESGVTTIIPIESDHSLIQLNSSGDRSAKRERWKRIAREALQQSGSPLITRVEEPKHFSSLEDFIKAGGIGFFCHQKQRKEGLIFPVLNNSPGGAPIGLVIGPEGGLSSKEVENLEKWGYHSLYFGDNVLRTETASLYAVAAVKTVLRELY